MKKHSFFFALAALVGSALISSCSMNRAGGGLSSYQAYDRPATLPASPSKVRVKVSLSKQRAYVLEGDKMLLVMPISVGKASTPTPTGSFRIFNKEAQRRANTHGYAKSGNSIRKTYLSNAGGAAFRGTPMPYWCEFKPAYGFHTGWVKHSPTTSGCIRMHENIAPKFFRLVTIGTPVNISYRQAEDSAWADMKLPPDAGPLPDYPTTAYYWNGQYFRQHKAPQFE